MDLEKYLVQKDNLNLLKRFAVLGSREAFSSKLNYLKMIAESETWNQTDYITGSNDSTLFYFIIHTFDRVFKQEKIFIDENEENSFFNTGLMDSSGNEIYAHFTKNSFFTPGNNYWYLKGFVKENDRDFMTLCPNPPKQATYFNDFNELYFDPNLEINLNYDHFYEDNFERLPDSLKNIDNKDIVIAMIDGFLSKTKKRIKRNNRIPVPQFYNDKISFLIPVNIVGDEILIIALEKINNIYRGNTILTMGMAYNCARLLNKPESNWLLNK